MEPRKFIEVLCSDRMPTKKNTNYVIITDKDTWGIIYFNGKRFEIGPYEPKIISWLEPVCQFELEEENEELKQKIKELESAYEGLLFVNKTLAKVHNTQHNDHFLLNISHITWLNILKMIDEMYYDVTTLNVVYIDGDVHLIPFALPKVIIECRDNQYICKIAIDRDSQRAINYTTFEKVTDYIYWQIS